MDAKVRKKTENANYLFPFFASSYKLKQLIENLCIFFYFNFALF